MIKSITLDIKTVSIFTGGFILGNVYGTLTTMKAAKKGIALLQGRIIK